MKNDQPGANVLANQKAWMADLEAFLAKHPDADEAPEVLLQLASANEFNGEEDEAHKQYAKMVETYPGTESAKKAAGSLRRLDLVGKALALKGTGLQNEAIDTAQYRGKTVLVVFWASWATPFKAELPELKKIAAKYRDRGLEVIGVNLDNERAEVDAFLKENPLDLAADLRGRRPGGAPGRRVRHHLRADHVPGRRPGQGDQPQHPHRRRARPPAREGPGGPEGRRRRRAGSAMIVPETSVDGRRILQPRSARAQHPRPIGASPSHDEPPPDYTENLSSRRIRLDSGDQGA